MISGEEIIDFMEHTSDLLEGEYDPDRDFQFHTSAKAASFDSLRLGASMAAIFLPNQPHRPQIAFGNTGIDIKKAVVKIPSHLI